MKKKYCIGFFVGIFLCVSLVGIGYQLSFQYVMAKQEAKAAPVRRAESVKTEGGAEKNEGYYVCELHGYVVVYLYDQTTIYEVTNIRVSDLPEEVQEKVMDKLYLETEEKLYGFLENYSS